MATITVSINTLNEEANLGECIKSVNELADEVVVVDMHSDDRTVEIAKSLGAKVFVHDRMGYADPARNFAFSKATSDWIFMLDADERVTPELTAEIRRVVDSPEANIYYVPRKNLLLGRWVQGGLWWPDYQLRLWRRGSIVWPKEIHGSPKPTELTVQIEAKPELALLHYAYNTVSEFVEMINTYTHFEAEELHNQGYSFRRRHLILQPQREFRRRFFETGGYKDGFDGLVLSVLLSFYKAVAILKYWEKYGTRDYKDKGQSKIRTVMRIMMDR